MAGQRNFFIFCLNDVNMLKGIRGFDPNWSAGIIEQWNIDTRHETNIPTFHYFILEENAVN